MGKNVTEVRIGVDLGGTKIEILALDRIGRERVRRRVPTPHGEYDATVKAISELVRLIGDDDTPIGVGIPGTISPSTGLVKNANSTCLIGRPLDRDLEEATGRRIRIANDADCFALSEATDGAGAEASIVFGGIIGTGVGGGLAINKSLVRGPNAIAGEWGHNPLPWPLPTAGELPGPLCYCGQSGCIETFLSGPALSQDHANSTGETLSPDEIVLRADDGHRGAELTMVRYVDRFARASASVINVLDPAVIVLGGGLSQISQLYTDVPKLWPKYVFSDTVATQMVPPRHGPASGVRGAVWLWP
jgi:fructokinase